MKINYIALCITFLLFNYNVSAQNKKIQSFNKAKKLLEKNVYFDHRRTLYCGAEFDSKKKIKAPVGFSSFKYKKRAKRVEWEHVVPAENFGRTFVEWRHGDKSCVDKKGKSFKGRNCASKTNKEYRYLQADMHNLYPAIGSVNAMRSNFNFVTQVNKASSFGSCQVKISNRKVEPPIAARGRIARTYMYMEQTYPRYSMSKSQRKLMIAWDKMYPVSEWECIRAKRIEAIQGNINPVYRDRCVGRL